MFSMTKVMTSLPTSLLIFLAIEQTDMGKDTTAFRERFNAYKNGKSVSEIYDAGLPRYRNGKKSVIDTLDKDQLDTLPAYNPTINPYISGKPMVKLRPRVQLPNLIELMEDSEWEPNIPGLKNGKLPRYKDGTRYLWDDQKGEWDRITDSDVANEMSQWAVTPYGVRNKFDYENNVNPAQHISKNAELKQDNDLWTRQQT